MKTFVLSAVSIVLVGIFFCPMVMAAPSMPADLQIVQPDPSLPKELSGFFGKWEGAAGNVNYFLIVEKIDEEKASLYLWRSTSFPELAPQGWMRYEAVVAKQRGKHKLQFVDSYGKYELTVKGEYLDVDGGVTGGARLKRVQ